MVGEAMGKGAGVVDAIREEERVMDFVIRGDAFRVKVIRLARKLGWDPERETAEYFEIVERAPAALEFIEARVAELEAAAKPRPLPSPVDGLRIWGLVCLDVCRGDGDDSDWEDINGQPFPMELCDGWLPWPDQSGEGEKDG